MGKSERGQKYLTLVFKRLLPDEVHRWKHRYLWHDEHVIASEFTFKWLPKPFEIMGRVVINNGYRGTCYELIGHWMEIIEARDMGGKVTGYYCNINTPPRIKWKGKEIESYRVTDLCLDVWVFPDGRYTILDEDEFAHALENGWISKAEGERAGEAVDKVIGWIKSGYFPPSCISHRTA